MPIEQILDYVVPICLAAVMFSLGLGVSMRDLDRIARRPGGVLLGLFAQLVLLPLVAFAVVYTFQFNRALAVGVMILASAPVGAASNLLTKWALGDESLSVTFTALTSLAALAMMPILLRLSVDFYYGEAFVSRIPINDLVGRIFLMATTPLLLGIGLRLIADRFALRIEGFVAFVANATFMALMVYILYRNWDDIEPFFWPLLFGLIFINVVIFLFSWLFSTVLNFPGSVRTAVIVETGMQNVLLAAFVGGILSSRVISNTFDGLSTFALPAAVYGVTSVFVILPFVLIRRAAHMSSVR